MAGYIIPFYSCINSIIANQHQAAFIECLVDGALVGLPMIFAGVKAGHVLFREATAGIGKTLSGPIFSASNQEIFRNVVPTSVQIAGGIAGTRSQMGYAMNIMTKEALRSIDPGFAALRSLSVVSKGLYLALLSRTVVGLGALSPRLVKISNEIPKVVSENLDLEGAILYSGDGSTPLTVSLKGISYSVMAIQNSSMVAVETGERTLDGQLLFAQLDFQSRLGIYKKYYCLNNAQAPRCDLKEYEYPNVRVEEDVYSASSKKGPYYWPISCSAPIKMVVVYPLHMLQFEERQWAVFEINQRRWAFDHQTGNMLGVDNTDDWEEKSLAQGGLVPMIELGDNNRSLGLHLLTQQPRHKRDAGLPRIQNWARLLANHSMYEDGLSGYSASIVDERDLSVKIGEMDYFLSIEKNAGTFLLHHRHKTDAPMFRVSYVIDSGDFVFASPMDLPNSHRLGEALRAKIAANPFATQKPYNDLLLPPLFNGAFSYGNRMFLKIGDRIMHIAAFNGVYHTLSQEGEGANGKFWTLRYELFTGNFDIVESKDRFSSALHGARDIRSRFELLASRTYNRNIYSSLATLCGMDYSHADTSPIPESDLYGRLRQTALLLRLDAHRRNEVLHASSVALRAFKMDRYLPAEWINDFQALALWATLEKTVSLCRSRKRRGEPLACQQWSHVKDVVWHVPAPVFMARGPDMRMFIAHLDSAAGAGGQKKEYELQLSHEGLIAKPLEVEGNLRVWMPPLNHDIFRTIATKSRFLETQHPSFWVDGENQVWAQTPDDVKIRLYRANNNSIVDDIVTSPDGSIVALIHKRSSQMNLALLYSLPSMGEPSEDDGLSFF
ncbi:hypothetical protein ABK905_20125 [Acerihabitans sp. KWT182]|uniref:Uncharacterized protein n=1 Tax=Acerihabitans sp. KWT182 TaxID=3157919 RepID=A0AAU7Q762_9GAMM